MLSSKVRVNAQDNQERFEARCPLRRVRKSEPRACVFCGGVAGS